MSYNVNTLVACQTLQAQLPTLWQQTNTQGADENMPYATWLFQQAAAVQQTILPGQSKQRLVQLTYFPRITEDEVNEDVSTPVCTSSDKRGNLSTTYSAPDQFLEVNELIDTDDLTNFCQDNGSYFLSRIEAMMDVLERKIATYVSQEAVTLAGTWGARGIPGTLFPTGTTPGSVNTSDEYIWRTRVSGSALTPAPVNPEAWWELRYALNKLGNNQPVLFGGKDGYSYFGATNVGCCSDSGIDINRALQAYGYSYSYDKRIEDAFGSTTKVLALGPNTLIPLWYVKGRWKDGVPDIVGNGATFSSMVVPSRRFGIPIDFTLNHPCGTEISMSMSVAVKTIALPNDQFLSGDVYFGKTNVNKIAISNP